MLNNTKLNLGFLSIICASLTSVAHAAETSAVGAAAAPISGSASATGERHSGGGSGSAGHEAKDDSGSDHSHASAISIGRASVSNTSAGASFVRVPVGPARPAVDPLTTRMAEFSNRIANLEEGAGRLDATISALSEAANANCEKFVKDVDDCDKRIRTCEAASSASASMTTAAITELAHRLAVAEATLGDHTTRLANTYRLATEHHSTLEQLRAEIAQLQTAVRAQTAAQAAQAATAKPTSRQTALIAGGSAAAGALVTLGAVALARKKECVIL